MPEKWIVFTLNEENDTCSYSLQHSILMALCLFLLHIGLFRVKNWLFFLFQNVFQVEAVTRLQKVLSKVLQNIILCLTFPCFFVVYGSLVYAPIHGFGWLQDSRNMGYRFPLWDQTCSLFFIRLMFLSLLQSPLSTWDKGRVLGLQWTHSEQVTRSRKVPFTRPTPNSFTKSPRLR